MRFKGSCGKIYCMRCVSDLRQTNDTCPLKCSSPFLVEAIPDVIMPFSCTYSSKPRELIININTNCLCDTDLVEVNNIHKLFTCHICIRKKECPKKCPKCEKYYCLRCKLMDIENDNTCCKDHELVTYNLDKFSPQVKLQN